MGWYYLLCCPDLCWECAIARDDKNVLQSMVNNAKDFSEMELFLLQSVNSVILEVPNNAQCREPVNCDLTMNGKPMPVVEQTSHIGISRSSDSDETTILENIKKA